MKLKPLPGYVVIEPLEEEMKTTSGFVIATTQKDRPVKGKILACGAQTKDEGCPVNTGDIVAYRKWSGDEVKVGEKDYRVVKFADVIAIYE